MRITAQATFKAIVHAVVLGIEMPVNPKRRFQDGVGPVRARVTKAWCRNVFGRMWEERLRDTPDALERRSGNEVSVVR